MLTSGKLPRFTSTVRAAKHATTGASSLASKPTACNVEYNRLRKAYSHTYNSSQQLCLISLSFNTWSWINGMTGLMNGMKHSKDQAGRKPTSSLHNRSFSRSFSELERWRSVLLEVLQDQQHSSPKKQTLMAPRHPMIHAVVPKIPSHIPARRQCTTNAWCCTSKIKLLMKMAKTIGKYTQGLG